MVQKLFGVFVLCADVNNKAREDHYGTQDEDSRVLRDVGITGWKDQGLLPMFFFEL